MMPPEISEDALELRSRLDPAAPLIPTIYESAADMLPFRARGVLGLPPEGVAAELVRMVLEGSLTLLEYAHSALLISSGFSADPRATLTGVDVSDGALTVHVSAPSRGISRRALMRFVHLMNALADGIKAEWTADPGYIEEVSRSLLLVCGGFDRAALGALLRSLKFRLEPDAHDGHALASFLCRVLRRDSSAIIRMSLPGSSFSVSCVDLGVDGAVFFSSELPKAVNYLIGSGDIVELVSGTVARRRALMLRGLPGPEMGPSGPRSLGALALDCSDKLLPRISGGLTMIRIRPGAYPVNPSTGAHVLFPAVEDEYVDLNVRVCPVCGTVTYSTRCPSCGAITEPARMCPSCRSVTKSEICERCGTPTVSTRRFRISFSKEISRFRRAEGLIGEAEFPGGAHEDLMKGLLRSRYGLRVHCDGTTRAAAVLLRARSVDSCSLMLPFKSARALFEISRFVDEVSSKIFSRSPPYELSSYRDLKGRDVIVLEKGGNVGHVAKVSGFVDAPVGFSGGSLPHGVVSLILPQDLAWNASYELARARAVRCRWGVPTALVGCESSGEEVQIPNLVLAESGMTSGATSAEARAVLQRVLERNLSILSSLGAKSSKEVCIEVRNALEDLIRLYASPEVVCESCGRKFRRPTMTGLCPYCGGRLRSTAEEPDLESLRALSDAVDGICGPSASITIDRLVTKERQARLTDFA
ncbi:MAG TPA: hypothetical protein ENO38_02315 [Nitrososphaeria archaeon]|nr:hypothetical protein [Nitrososphaeria archaeon]